MSESEDRPLGAFITSLIGGVLILAAGAILAAAGSVVGAVAGGVGGLLVGLGALGVFFGLLIVILAIVMFISPDFHLLCGIGILILSLLSIVAGSGFFLGLLLGVIGGILGIVFQPSEDYDEMFRSPTTSAPGGGRVCRNCAAAVPPGPSQWCPRCGHPL
ncbi:MAG TPA: hypothetical protein VFG07_01330 [Thermoplasmata archaeon]|nr:hypothetical protein [Thermoplasmata archaeon]